MQTTSTTPLRRLPSGALDTAPYILAGRVARAEEFRAIIRGFARVWQRARHTVVIWLRPKTLVARRAA